MTNFEKWREGLTVEDLADIIDSSPGCPRRCPAKEPCAGSVPCKRHFLDWANQEVGE